MSFLSFLRENARWLAGGFLLTLFSSFGQTFFIALSAGEIRSDYGLSHGQWGSLYMGATLASALSLPWVGTLVDRMAIWRVGFGTIVALAVACVAMAASNHVAMLVLVIYLLRLFGQGMMTHIAFTGMGKWYAAQRGRAISIASIGLNFGEACLPLSFVLVSGLFGWRNAWIAAAGILIAIALPAISFLFSRERQPRSSDPEPSLQATRDWTRGEVLRDPLFYILMIGIMAPPFIGTTIFFHQVHLVEIRGWSLEVFAAAFPVMSVMVVSFALIAGQLIDRYTAVRLLPTFLIPLAVGCLALGYLQAQWSAFVFMAFIGISYGISSTLFGALWPEIYGTAHLGAVRSTIVAFMVFATAAGPGITGYLIDLGVAYPLQISVMGIYCVCAALLMVAASRRAIARNSQNGAS